MPLLTLYGNQPLVDNLNTISDLVTDGFGIGNEVASLVANAGTAVANLRHLRPCHDLGVPPKVKAYNSTVPDVLLNICKTLLLHTKNTWRIPIFGPQYL